ncbi:NAD-dependent epimerase/dehydratase family protein [Orrella sp. 11846]|uniref:NAD-dependent epimerase/dehydratase family protein n=1 Tax=Orrella sp. 11846 TaxID=3409913 RepID=UPI003B598FE2
MSKTLLITGVTGFVGKQVLQILQTTDHHLRVVVRNPKSIEWPSGTTVVQSQDLFAESAQWWNQVAQNVDAVLHLAWYAEPGLYLRSPRNLSCLQGTLSMAQGCADAGVPRFVGVGTCFEYDTSFGYLSTKTPLNPTSPYAAAKAAAWLFLREYFQERQVSLAWCRLFNLYGAGEDSRRLIPYVHQQLSQGQVVELTAGTQIRDYLDVREAAKQLVIHLLGSQEGAINICSGRGQSVRNIVESIADQYDRHDLLRFGERSDNFTDPPIVVGIKD